MKKQYNCRQDNTMISDNTDSKRVKEEAKQTRAATPITC